MNVFSVILCVFEYVFFLVLLGLIGVSLVAVINQKRRTLKAQEEFIYSQCD